MTNEERLMRIGLEHSRRLACLPEDVQWLMRRVRELEAALEKIAKPSGVYRRDHEKYFENVINACIAIAVRALKGEAVKAE